MTEKYVKPPFQQPIKVCVMSDEDRAYWFTRDEINIAHMRTRVWKDLVDNIA